MGVKELQTLQVPCPILGLKVWRAQSPRQAIMVCGGGGGEAQQLITKLPRVYGTVRHQNKEKMISVVLTPGETQGTIKET